MPLTITTTGEIDEDALREFLSQWLQQYVANNPLPASWIMGDQVEGAPSVLIQPDGIQIDYHQIAGRSLIPIPEWDGEVEGLPEFLELIRRHVNLSRTGS